MRRMILILLILPTIHAISIEVQCPESAEYNQEFTCKITAINTSNQTYDIKIQIKLNDTTINQIDNGEEFGRSDWYVQEYIREDKTYNIDGKFHKEIYGKAVGVVKIRQSGTTAVLIQEEFNITSTQPAEDEIPNDKTAAEEEKEETTITQKSTPKEERKLLHEPIEKKEEQEKKNEKETVINLNKPKQTSQSELDFTSKEGKIQDIATYLFIALLIATIGILTYEKW